MQKPGIFGQLINIETKDGKHFVLPRDIQFHPVRKILHIFIFKESQTNLTLMWVLQLSL